MGAKPHVQATKLLEQRTDSREPKAVVLQIKALSYINTKTLSSLIMRQYNKPCLQGWTGVKVSTLGKYYN